MSPHAPASGLNPDQVDELLKNPALLDVHFQPVTGFDTRSICGAEALLRATLDGVVLPPPAVIAAAVEAGRIREIGKHVLGRACLAYTQWHDAGHDCVTMMVNVDAAELLDPDLVLTTQAILDDFGLHAESVVLELTETAFIEDLAIVRRNLTGLRELGLGLALDDFGAGYASLSHLRSVPLSVVKLDRQFVSKVDDAGTDHEIVRNVIRLGHALGLRVVAEGVETEGQRLALEALGCDAWQGFLRSPAVTSDEFLGALDASAVSNAVIAPPTPSEIDVLDSFVLRRIGVGRWAHIGGHGRGEGWAGIVEVDETKAPVILHALTDGVQRVGHGDQRWLIGPYHPRCAVVVPVDADTVVIFGSTSEPSLPSVTDAQWTERAVDLAEKTTTVSPAKRLADELEMSEALQSLISNKPETLDEAMRHVVLSTAQALSCEFAVLYLPTVGKIAFDDHTIHNVDHDEFRAALDRLAAITKAPICVQNADERPLPLPMPSDYRVRSWIALPAAPAFGGLLICAHTDRSPRGFTTMCQNLGRKLADTAELVLHAGAERERLRWVATSASAEARMDSLTGLLNRRGWDDAIAACSRSGELPVSIIVADLNDLKRVNDCDGHAAGDRLLVTAARSLSTLVRGDDIVARIGGDEFAILMRGADHLVCHRFMGELARLLELERIALADLSIAVGHATNLGHESLAETFASADASMYRAKGRVKGRVTGSPAGGATTIP